MPRTYRQKRKLRRKTRMRKGGSAYYYPYNKTPLLFTEPSNKFKGGWGGDSRSTFFPALFTDISQSTQYSTQSSTNAFLGKAPPVNPSVTSQPINK